MHRNIINQQLGHMQSGILDCDPAVLIIALVINMESLSEFTLRTAADRIDCTGLKQYSQTA